MQDIDFDEIDRAVSSITNKDSGEVTYPEANNTPSEESVAPVSTPLAPVIAPTQAVPSPAMRRSTGRFMDVVHPSSDMRPKAPSAPSLHREEVPHTEVEGRPEPAAVASTAFHWPDPIDLVESEPAADPQSVVETVVENTTIEAEAPQETVIASEETTPLESPFLTDAKVEKRPLGAFSTSESSPELSLPEISTVPSTEVTPEVPDAEVVPAPTIEPESSDIPRELHEDVLMLESHSEDEEAPAPLTTDDVKTPDAIEDIPVGPTSITQQYKEQPNTASQQSGSIYDTEAYHQPLTHTPKKHTGALVIVWIIALILVGGGIGAAVYFVLLPMLG